MSPTHVVITPAISQRSVLNLMYISICHQFHYVKDAANTRLQTTHHAQIARIGSDLVQQCMPASACRRQTMQRAHFTPIVDISSTVPMLRTGVEYRMGKGRYIML